MGLTHSHDFHREGCVDAWENLGTVSGLPTLRSNLSIHGGAVYDWLVLDARGEPAHAANWQKNRFSNISLGNIVKPMV